jgi:hypothetical protein
VLDLVDALGFDGFDGIDAETLADSWRIFRLTTGPAWR